MPINSALWLKHLGVLISTGAHRFYDEIGFTNDRRDSFHKTGKAALNNIVGLTEGLGSEEAIQRLLNAVLQAVGPDVLRYARIYSSTIMETNCQLGRRCQHPLSLWVSLTNKLTQQNQARTPGDDDAIWENEFVISLLAHHENTRRNLREICRILEENKLFGADPYMEEMYEICLLDEEMHRIIIGEAFEQYQFLKYWMKSAHWNDDDFSELFTILKGCQHEENRFNFWDLMGIEKLKCEWQLLAS